MECIHSLISMNNNFRIWKDMWRNFVYDLTKCKRNHILPGAGAGWYTGAGAGAGGKYFGAGAGWYTEMIIVYFNLISRSNF